jgi:hypothetical protein
MTVHIGQNSNMGEFSFLFLLPPPAPCCFFAGIKTLLFRKILGNYAEEYYQLYLGKCGKVSEEKVKSELNLITEQL